MFSKVTKLCLEMMQFPHLGRGYHRVSGVLPPLLRVEIGVLNGPTYCHDLCFDKGY